MGKIQRVTSVAVPLLLILRLESHAEQTSLSLTTMAQVSTEDIFAVMPSRTADLNQTWEFLNSGVVHIMTKLEDGLSFTGYTNLYTTVYNYCTSTKMHGKLDGNRSKRSNSVK